MKKSYTSSFQGKCNLCLDEKISIVKYKDTINSLNERKEFIGKCRHENKYLIWYQIIFIFKSCLSKFIIVFII